MRFNHLIAYLTYFAFPALSAAQIPLATLRCAVLSEDGRPLPLATVYLPGLHIGGATDSLGTVELKNLPSGELEVEASYVGFFPQRKKVLADAGSATTLAFHLALMPMDEVVITGTMREIRRSNSTIPVELISSKLFLRNPTPNLFESVGMLSGIQPVLNCNVCNTGDIQINGMDGVYTQVLLDGMPIVSGLGAVYGLMGIPNSLIDRIEVVKGPAGSLYGSEAMAGQINIITKNPDQAPRLALETFSTNWGEWNVDAGWKIKTRQQATALWGLNGFWFQNRVDQNQDGFTDLALQKRLSLFNKWQWNRPDNQMAQLGARFVREDRWGGELEWNPGFRGGDVIYGESIYTNRLEAFGTYQLPGAVPVFIQASYAFHNQDSYYGIHAYNARQDIAFGQMYMDKSFARHHLLAGVAMRYSFYDDNTPAMAFPSRTWLPGAFAQSECKFPNHNDLLTGIRLDWHPDHGAIWSPRIAFHQHLGENQSLRWSAGSGFRVVSLFTEDHAALSGAREVVIRSNLNPERSWSSALNYHLKIPSKRFFLDLDATAFYTWFSNRILPDYDTDPQKIIYSNLDGSAHSRGITLQGNYSDGTPLTLNMGITFMDVFSLNDEGEKSTQIRAPKWSGTFLLSYTQPASQITFDLNGNWYGPQRLPVVPYDFRPAYSPWFAILNFQISRKFRSGFELFGGVKNLLHFVPQDPILRPFDPFDRLVDDPINNPFSYTFDPSYNYAPVQGIRGFLGMRFSLSP
jgi:outer membrane receptor for ferrienterochelin and colicins